MNLSSSANEGIQFDPKVIADSLMYLTSGWSPEPGVAPEVLTTARKALAVSLVAGKSLTEIHAAQLPVKGLPGTNPKLEKDLLRIASDVVAEKPAPSIAIIRSFYAATVTNPSGAPDWARSAHVVESFGPFVDLSGVQHRVEVISFTSSIPFAFGDPSAPFGVFPVLFHLQIIPASCTVLTLGSGSVWFLANWLETTLPAGAFTGFTITGGTLFSSQEISFENGVYIVPTTANLTIKLTLASAPQPSATGNIGLDAAAAVFTPPSEVTLTFKQSSAAFQSIASASTAVYGSNVTLGWNVSGIKVEVVKVSRISGELPEILVPCTASPTSFSFLSATSEIFKPSGKASIDKAGWALPLVTTNVTALPTAAGPGAALLRLTGGGSLKTNTLPVTSMSEWVVEVLTGGLNIFSTGNTAAMETAFQLWPESTPLKLNSTVKFFTNQAIDYGYMATPANESLITSGLVETHLDRPLTAIGKRVAYRSSALLMLYKTQAETLLYIFGTNENNGSTIVPLALENALIGVENPIFVLSGTLTGTQLQKCQTTFSFELRWLLPTLPDPYASNFDLLTWDPDSENKIVRTVIAITSWTDQNSKPQLAFTLNLPDFNVEGNSVLLDLSTRADLLGVGYLGSSGGSGMAGTVTSLATNDSDNPTQQIAFSSMSLELNSAKVATFALPQFSWEPMLSDDGLIACIPASDGIPLYLLAPDTQQLVPFAPEPVLMSNIKNVAAGIPFTAIFSLPFGLIAVIKQNNSPDNKGIGNNSTFLSNGGRFSTNIPHFSNSSNPIPTTVDPVVNRVLPANPPQELTGVLTLSLKPENLTNPMTLFHPTAQFSGYTEISPFDKSPGYGMRVLGDNKSKISTDVGEIFNGEFGSGVKNSGVPLRRIDFSGYGASTFSEWIDEISQPPSVTKVHFEASIGRTALDVIQVASVIYPYCIKAVRTIVMKRQNAGLVKRTDSDWQPVSAGKFDFPHDPQEQDPYSNRKHLGPLIGVYNVRNIREDPKRIDPITVDDPYNKDKMNNPIRYEFRQILLDADVELDGSLNVINGGFEAENSTRVASKDMVGYLQLSPDEMTPSPTVLELLFKKTGPLKPVISCTVEAGNFNGTAGTKFRCSALEVDMITEPNDPNLTPAVGVALRGAPQIPRGGGWSMGRRSYSDPAPSALPTDYPVPLVRPNISNDLWYIADIADILQLDRPFNYYSLLHSTGTQKILFESPQIPTSSTVSTHATPGLQFSKPVGPGRVGSTANPGSPNLGDLASILNSTGLFPDIASTISRSDAIEHIDTIDAGLRYSKTFPFISVVEVPIYPNTNTDEMFSIVMVYGYEYTDPNTHTTATKPTEITYIVDSSQSPSWSLKMEMISLHVIVSAFGKEPLLTISGQFYADEHTAPGISNLNVQLGEALGIVKQAFSALQMLAKFLPGGSGASLDVALSNGKLMVSDTFTISDLPLGLGNLTDVSLNMGLNVELQSRKAGFIVGVGSPDNPFNWIATPLAGNGFMTFGWQDDNPAVTIQAGIGLGIAIDLGIAKGSASVVLAFRFSSETRSVMVILTGRADVDVLEGLASASLTLSTVLEIKSDPQFPSPTDSNSEISIGPVTVYLFGAVSVGIHLSICWLVSVNWDGNWHFSQSITMPKIAVNA